MACRRRPAPSFTSPFDTAAPKAPEVSACTRPRRRAAPERGQRRALLDHDAAAGGRVQENLGRRQHGAAAHQQLRVLAYTSIWPESYTPRPGVPPRNIAPADSAFRSEAWIAAALGPRMGACPAARISSPWAGPLTTRLPAYPPLSFGTPKRARP